MSDFEYECEHCHVVTEAERMSWPDLCDRCHWRANLGANFAAAGMAAVLELMYESYTSSIDLLRRHSFADSWLAIGMAATLDKIAEADCCHQGIAVDAVDTMREAVS